MTKRKMTKKKLPAAAHGPDVKLSGKQQPNPDVTSLDDGPGRVSANAYLTQSGVRFMSMTFQDLAITSALLKDGAPRRVRVIIPNPDDLSSILVWNCCGRPRPHFVEMPNCDSKLAGVPVRLWQHTRKFAEQQNREFFSGVDHREFLDALRKHSEHLANRPPICAARSGFRRPRPTASTDLGGMKNDRKT